MPWMLRIATGPRVLMAVVVALAGTGLLFGTGPFPRVRALAPGGRLPEEQLGYPPAKLTAFLAAIGPEGRADYILFQRLDILTPLLLGGAAALLIAWLLRRGGAAAGWTTCLPYLPVLFLLTEVAEDFALARAARLYPAASPLSPALPLLTGAKFAAMLLTCAVIVICSWRVATPPRRAARSPDRPGRGAR